MKFLALYPFTGFQKISLAKTKKLHLLGSVCHKYFTYIIFYDLLSHTRKEVRLLYFSAEDAGTLG